ncbi:F-box/LRR-repeat protein [Nymphaea thermarum]|nr:F-box/LRR-repeat protein [Nymphaea thermarum]
MGRRGKRATRITDLQEAIMLKILRHLDLKSTIRTCAATRRWRTLLPKLPALEFDIADFPVPSLRRSFQKQARRNFTAAVTRLLSIRDGRRPLERFSIRYNLRDAPIKQEINYWLKSFSQRLMIEEICINVDAESKEEYRLNFNQYGCTSLRVLQLRGCRFNQHCSSMDFPSLTTLAVANSHITFLFLQSLLRNLPLLHTLSISDCSCLGPELPVEAPHLRKFSLRGRPPFEFNMPNLVSEEVEDVLRLSLEERPTARLDINPLHPSMLMRRKFIITYAFSRLPVVRLLILTARTLIVIGRWCYLYLLPEFRNHLSGVEEMVVHGARLTVEELRGLGALLERCSDMRSIKFEMNPSEDGTDPRFVLRRVRVALAHLRTLTVQQYGGYQRDEELVRYFLKKAPGLTSIIINPSAEARRSWDLVVRLRLAVEEHRATRPDRPTVLLEFPGWELD